MDQNCKETFESICDSCPACNKYWALICANCINERPFLRNRDGERIFACYSELLKKWLRALDELRVLKNRIQERVAPREAYAAKINERERLKISVQLLKVSVNEAKQKSSEQMLHQLKRRGEKAKAYISSSRAFYSQYVCSKMVLMKRQEKLNTTMLMLKETRCQMAKELARYIFQLSYQHFDSAIDKEQYVVLDPFKTCQFQKWPRFPAVWTYIAQYKIVESVLPGDGDFSRGFISEADQLLPFSKSRTLRTRDVPRYGIMSGVLFAAQMMLMLNRILYIVQPTELKLKALVYEDLDMEKLNLLNQNIAYLCLTQGVNPVDLIPDSFIYNLKLLLQSKFLGEDHVFLQFAIQNAAADPDSDWDLEEINTVRPDIDLSSWNVVKCPITRAR